MRRLPIYLVPVAVLLVGFCLWAVPSFWAPLAAGDVRSLGEALLGGAVVALAVLAVEFLISRRAEKEESRRTERDEKLNLQLTINSRDNLRNIDLKGRNLEGFYFGDKDLSGAKFVGANLEATVLAHAKLERAVLTGANLTGVDLMQANLTGARLEEATLVAAHLAGANCVTASFQDAILEHATLWSADFTQADFRDANLTGAQINNCKFKGADLRGADLTGASVLSRFDGAKYDGRTIWPPYFNYEAAGAVSEDGEA